MEKWKCSPRNNANGNIHLNDLAHFQRAGAQWEPTWEDGWKGLKGLCLDKGPSDPRFKAPQIIEMWSPQNQWFERQEA